MASLVPDQKKAIKPETCRAAYALGVFEQSWSAYCCAKCPLETEKV